MLNRNNLQPEICQESCDNIRELVIKLPFLELCPLCNTQSIILQEILQHILDHLTLDQFDQARLMSWLSSINYEKNSKLSTQNDVFQNFSIELREISSNIKCPYCHKFISPEISLKNHVFEHFRVPDLRKEHLRLWFRYFFKNEESVFMMKRFNNVITETKKLNLANSTLLKRLPMFVNQKTYTCRWCKLKLPDASTLYAHNVEWHSELRVKTWNCFTCNFKETDDEKFVAHVYKNHLYCFFCKKKFQLFKTSINHIKLCSRRDPHCSDSGVHCPFCKNFQSTEEKQFVAHLQTCKPWISVPHDTLRKGMEQKKVLDNHYINFSDIESHLDERISAIIKNHFDLK